jgi:hypothetical protein
LWNELAVEGTPVAKRLLIGEACRLADRLDKLDELLSGDVDVWARLVHRVRTDDYVLRIDAAESAARQSASALRQILAQLAGQQLEVSGGSIADEIAARRAAREAGSAG